MPEARKRTPKPVPQQRDPRSLPLSPTDGFVLSRVDGAMSDGDLAVSTGLPEELVLASLTKLEGLGLITFDGAAEKARPEPPPTPAQQPTPSAASPSTVTPAPAAAPAPRAQTPFPKGAPLTPEEETALAEDVDLDLDFRKAILGKHRKLEADHYEMLGVPRNADRKAIKRAYFDLAARFHPDRYFRKRLGSFKVRMEAVFAAVTTANDVLGSRDKRAEYDAYLAEQRRSRSIEDLLEAAVAEAQQAAESAEEEARAQARVQSSPNQAAMQAPPAPSGAAPSPSPVPSQVASPSGQRPAPTEADIAARREALARRLLGGRSRQTPMPGATLAGAAQSPGPPAAPMGSGDAMDALKRRYEERIALAKKAKARAYIDQGEAALAKGDLLTAATSLRIAADLVPNDPELEAKAQSARHQADAILCDTYTKQAQYEETSQRWADAARSWGRVCRAAPSNIDAHVHAVTAILNSRGDLHEAARLAKRACEAEPSAAKHRVMLGSVFLAAGLGLNARRELDTAAQMAPQDDTIKQMIRRLGAVP